MSKYIVKDTQIFHGSKGAKEATLYAPGDEIELTDAEAAALGDRVEAAPEAEPKGKKEK